MAGTGFTINAIWALTLKFWCCNLRRGLKKKKQDVFRRHWKEMTGTTLHGIRGNAMKKENADTKAFLKARRLLM